ncbi:M1 family metallopeptidase [Fundidesulfovibrio agrisoli]|uniref:M1 family metallopeptidase n=1 Tax=Fundidesulfovibrio agrisoli TaxID=2922717 RepID=UPI001FAE6710|nr:M1 family aminopeptidase [Fundidesulfovibrio agrisoli]
MILRALFLLLALVSGAATALAAAPLAHSIDAVLDLPGKRLLVTDAITLPEPRTAAELTLTLAPSAAGLAVEAGGNVLKPARSGETVRVTPPKGAMAVTLRYTIALGQPPQAGPGGTDNPGALADEAVAGPDWAMLMPGSLWHPAGLTGQDAYHLRVSATGGVKAVSQGGLEGFSQEGENTVSTWNVRKPVGRLGLCLARYVFEERRETLPGGSAVAVQTFFLPESKVSPDIYLEAAARHLRFYSELHGPYPLEKFAVVENPLPTGYGFPSYTLLGSQVLALPFIPETSLRHEVAHGWWGNGVLVAGESGNWCEGLTTYVADYLAQELAAPAEGKAYRLRTLRAFSALTAQTPGADMPLERFGSRFSAASQAVGYGKAIFVFHMLRGFTGDEAFWAGLRHIYAAKLFQPAAWEDFRETFAGQGEFSQERGRRFMEQWLTRTGGPVMSLDQATSEPDPAGGWVVKAEAVQKGAPYLLRLAAQVDYEGGTQRTEFVMEGERAGFELRTPGKPLRLRLDPDADCFRLLDPSEVPPSVNTVKGARELRVLVAADAPQGVRAALPVLLGGLGQTKAAVLEEEKLTPEQKRSLESGNVLVLGMPRFPLPGLRDVMPDAPGADTVFAALEREGGCVAVFQASARGDAGADAQAVVQAVVQAANKVTHYGSFGLLGFAGGRNVLKATLEPRRTPMLREFD